MLLVRVTAEHAPAEWPEPALVNAVFSGQLHPETSVSLDGGRSWMAAGVVAQRLRARGSDELALFVPQRTEPWSVADAPAPFVEAQLKAIVGIEIPISRIEGKWKVSQNRPEADRRGVVEGLRLDGDPASAAMAELVAERSRPAG